MDGLVKIEANNIWHRRRMKDGSGEFMAKLTPGGGLYFIKFDDDTTTWHRAETVEKLSEEVK